MQVRADAPAKQGDSTVLMYHGVAHNPQSEFTMNARSFEEQIAWIAKNFDLIGVDGAMPVRKSSRRPRLLITFDDGFRNNLEVVTPILIRHSVPATFFVCSRHGQAGEYLWFVYLRALENHFKWNGFTFRGEFQDTSVRKRGATLRHLMHWLLSLEPHPAAMYTAIQEEFPVLKDFVPSQCIDAEYSGLTAEQLGDLARQSLFSIGAHTVDHPLLSRCSGAEAEWQLKTNQQWIESASGKRCQWISYPGGDYSDDTLRICQRLGFSRGFAVIPRFDSGSVWEHARVGVYSPSRAHLRLRMTFGQFVASTWYVSGVAPLRQLRLRSGI